MSQLFGGGSSPQAAKAPPFAPVNIPQTADLINQYANLGYNMADADFLNRFPGLVSIRDSEINDAASQITSPLDPSVQSSFLQTAENQSLSAFGGAQGSLGTAGSAARGATAAGFTNEVSANQDYNFNTLMNLLNANPERTYDLTPDAALQLLVGNTVGKNQANFAGYQAAVNQANASQAAGAQEATGIASTAISIIGLAL